MRLYTQVLVCSREAHALFGVSFHRTRGAFVGIASGCSPSRCWCHLSPVQQNWMLRATEPNSVPETILDAFEEDLERRNRRLVLADGSRRQGSTTETYFTQWDSDAQFSMPSRPSEFQSQIVDMTVMDFDSSPVVTPKLQHATCPSCQFFKEQICRIGG